MYCIKCGVELADSEKKCPLCGTRVYHPEIHRPEAEKLYPPNLFPPQQVRPWGVLLIISMLFVLAMLITLICDLQINHRVSWSGFVIGGLLVSYVALVLPFWFRRPNPVVFVPCTFGAVGLYLLYIDLVTEGSWFLSFAFPVTIGVGVIITTLVTLTRYIHRGRLYIYGGAAIITGLFMPLMEFLLNMTFNRPMRFIWSLYPLSALVLLGITLLVVATCRPLRESLGKRLFL